MSKGKLVVLILVLIIAFWVVYIKSANNLLSPLVKPTAQLTPVPSASPNAPKQIKFDKSTDLIKELELIDPQVLDSDF